MVGIYTFFSPLPSRYIRRIPSSGGKLVSYEITREEEKGILYFLRAEWLAAATSSGGRSVKKVSLTTIVYFPWGPFHPSFYPPCQPFTFVREIRREGVVNQLNQHWV